MLPIAVLVLFVAGADSAKPCPSKPAAELMSLPYDAFDIGDGPAAWRSLLNRGCVDTAVATLEAYRHANEAQMTPEQSSEIHFHMGQALAMSGRNADSIPHFERASTSSSSAEWKAYVAANLAFVRKDRPALEQALTDYGKMSSPTSTRLGFIRGFLKCIDKPYMEAAHCGM
jgi:hypothetical protein